jgi:hypothetical protein
MTPHNHRTLMGVERGKGVGGISAHFISSALLMTLMYKRLPDNVVQAHYHNNPTATMADRS